MNTSGIWSAWSDKVLGYCSFIFALFQWKHIAVNVLLLFSFHSAFIAETSGGRADKKSSISAVSSLLGLHGPQHCDLEGRFLCNESFPTAQVITSSSSKKNLFKAQLLKMSDFIIRTEWKTYLSLKASSLSLFKKNLLHCKMLCHLKWNSRRNTAILIQITSNLNIIFLFTRYFLKLVCYYFSCSRKLSILNF